MKPNVATEAEEFFLDMLPGIPPGMGLRPLVFTAGPRGRQRMPVHLPPEETLHDTQHAIAAFLTITLAREVSLLSFTSLEPCDPDTGLPESVFGEDGDREIAVVGHWYPGGERMTYADVSRGGRHRHPEVGEWAELRANIEIIDLLGDAIRSGLSMVLRLALPENADLRERLDGIRDDDDVYSMVPDTYQELMRRGWLD